MLVSRDRQGICWALCWGQACLFEWREPGCEAGREARGQKRLHAEAGPRCWAERFTVSVSRSPWRALGRTEA